MHRDLLRDAAHRPAFKPDPDAMLITARADGRILVANAGFEKLFGRRKGDLVGRTVSELGICDDRDEAERIHRGLVVDGSLPGVTMRGRTGSGLPLDLLLSAESFELGGTDLVLSVWEDLAVRRVAGKRKDSLRQEQKMEVLGTLAGGIAHDLNNLLTPIAMGVEFALWEDTDPAKARAQLADVRRLIKSVAALVRRILEFSHRQESHRTLIRLQPVLADVVRMIRSSLPPTVKIELIMDPEAPPVLADSNQILQVVTNLCANAAHAMRGRSGRLSIGLAAVNAEDMESQEIRELRPGRHVCLKVCDTGHGMDAGMLQRIFEPFFTTKPPGEGTGLGLAIVQGIVREHDGVITVRSRPGEGTSFAIYFPAQEVGGLQQSPQMACATEA